MHKAISMVFWAAVLLAWDASAEELEPGRGLYNVSPRVLTDVGYPDAQHDFYDGTWGLVTDAEGVSFGPGSYFDGDTRLMHPYLTITEEAMESRWITLAQSDCCSEALLGRFLEMLDLAYVDMTEALEYTPERKLRAYTPTNLNEYLAISGKEFWVTHRVDGAAMLFQDVPNLFRRTLIGHVVRAAVADALLDLKCHGRLEPWFQEGLTSYLAQEGFEHLSFMYEFRLRREVLLSPAEMIEHVYPLEDREMGRIARYNAFLVVWRLAENHGWDRILRLLDLVADGMSFHAAMETEYGLTEAEFFETFDPREFGEPTTAGVRVTPDPER